MPRHNGARTAHASAVVLHQKCSPTSSRISADWLETVYYI
jgi:hypothetical protein